MKPFLNWLENRTGIFALMHEALYERVPGGARWRYVWGSTLVFAFSVQMITGLFLWMAYSPSSQTAWESVYYIQHDMQFGWLLRGLHHFMAQTMIVLLVLHLMQIVIDGAYKAPREVNFWLGLILMKLTLALALTGYLLPWDQRGYWSTGVATSLMSLVPFGGEQLQKLVVGGSEYGHHTLTRFFALHAGVLPALLIGFLVLHIAIFRKHGLHPKKEDPKKDCYFWPDQVLRDGVACLAVLCVVLFCIGMPVFLGHVDLTMAKADPGAHLGAHLTAPADPSNKFSAARPEWYFLFLFQFLKFFHGEDAERMGAIYLPGAAMGVLFLMPIVGRWKLGHRFNVLFLFAIALGAAGLTAQAWYDDNMATVSPAIASKLDKVPGFQGTEAKLQASQDYVKAVHQAEDEAKRVVELVRSSGGIPTAGAVSLLRKDAQTQGPRLFVQHCASCHSWTDGTAGHGIVSPGVSAPNLYGFADRAWLTRLLDPKHVAGPDMFGKTKHKEGEMVTFVRDDLPSLKADEVKQVIVTLSAEAQLPAQSELDETDAAAIIAGKKLLETLTCTDCHKYGDVDNGGGAPDLTGYGTRDWLTAFITDPAHERFYGERNDRMPAFAKDPKNPKNNKLTPQEIAMLVDWLRGEGK